MAPVIHIGPAALSSTLLALFAAFWLGTQVAEYESRRRALPGDLMWNAVFLGAGVAVVVGRLAYVVRNWSAYAGDPLQIVALTPATLAPEVGGVLGVVAALAYIQHRRVRFAPALDAAAPGALVALGILALGQYANGDAFGTPAVLPWSVFLWGDLRHPVQLYEAWGIWFGFIVVWQVRSRPWPPGTMAWLVTAWYAAVRVFVDAFRADTPLLPGGYRTVQVIAWIVLVTALAGLARRMTGIQEVNGNERTDSDD